jgi:hypothetical protein
MRMRSLCFIVVLAAAMAAFGFQGCDKGGDGGDGGQDGGEDGGQTVAHCSDTFDGGSGVESWNGVPPATLSGTGLYQCVGGVLTPANGIRSFHPTYALWSDGIQKSRWISLPPNTQIDTSNMDHWSFPAGTRLWKEFVVNGKRVETRLIARTDAGPDDFMFAVYQWNADQTDAVYEPGGVANANGTDHDIPTTDQCLFCHRWLPEKVLGFSAIQLTHASSGSDDVSLSTLVAEGRLTVAPADGGYTVPGDAVTAAALGYLHANCGNCHNSTGISSFQTPFSLHLDVGARTPAETSAYLTAVGVPVDKYIRPGITHRVAPGNPDASCVPARMSQRVYNEQMPPIATKYVDDAGVAAIKAWILSLPP